MKESCREYEWYNVRKAEQTFADTKIDKVQGHFWQFTEAGKDKKMVLP